MVLSLQSTDICLDRNYDETSQPLDLPTDRYQARICQALPTNVPEPLRTLSMTSLPYLYYRLIFAIDSNLT